MNFNGVYFHVFSSKLDSWELSGLVDMFSILSRFLFANYIFYFIGMQINIVIE